MPPAREACRFRPRRPEQGFAKFRQRIARFSGWRVFRDEQLWCVPELRGLVPAYHFSLRESAREMLETFGRRKWLGRETDPQQWAIVRLFAERTATWQQTRYSNLNE